MHLRQQELDEELKIQKTNQSDSEIKFKDNMNMINDECKSMIKNSEKSTLSKIQSEIG